MLFRLQYSFTSASEIHVFGDNFLFCDRNLPIFFSIERRLSFFQIKRKNRSVPGLASDKKDDLSFSQVQALWKKPPFVYVRALDSVKFYAVRMCNAIMGNHLMLLIELKTKI